MKKTHFSTGALKLDISHGPTFLMLLSYQIVPMFGEAPW